MSITPGTGGLAISGSAPSRERTVQDWQHFVRIAEDAAVRTSALSRAVAFRGQAKAEWTLRPTLTRLVERLEEISARRMEYEALAEFRRHAHLHVPTGMMFPD